MQNEDTCVQVSDINEYVPCPMTMQSGSLFYRASAYPLYTWLVIYLYRSQQSRGFFVYTRGLMTCERTALVLSIRKMLINVFGVLFKELFFLF